MTGESIPVTPGEAASGILGSISLTCWIFLLVPQLIENYRNGNAEAISLLFLFVWFLGDITNLAGSAWAGLVPVIVAIAVYFCLADGVLITQCLYYRARNSRRSAALAAHPPTTTAEPTTPLLGRRTSDVLVEGGADSRRRRGSRTSYRAIPETGANGPSQDPDYTLAKLVEENRVGRGAWFKNLSSVLAICVIGMAGWTVAWQTGAWKPAPPEGGNGGVDMAPGAQVLGYISAACYLGARLPQIYKNYCDKSCEGEIVHLHLYSICVS
ncbi:PQ-loop repeat-containing protein [Aspergillus lucknowensis]|uniref:PQ loop repeat-domain-containing protein n=1 Tax=Aspergillus lucknowensis TaxID=176173 RepID=A0ABR4LJS4_9EURO